MPGKETIGFHKRMQHRLRRLFRSLPGRKDRSVRRAAPVVAIESLDDVVVRASDDINGR